MGLNVTDTSLQDFIKNAPYTITSADDKALITFPMKSGSYRYYLPEQISAMILGKVKYSTEAYLGKKIKKVVITVPARFTQAQRTATINAAKIAGFVFHKIAKESRIGASLSFN